MRCEVPREWTTKKKKLPALDTNLEAAPVHKKRRPVRTANICSRLMKVTCGKNRTLRGSDTMDIATRNAPAGQALIPEPKNMG